MKQETLIRFSDEAKNRHKSAGTIFIKWPRMKSYIGLNRQRKNAKTWSFSVFLSVTVAMTMENTSDTEMCVILGFSRPIIWNVTCYNSKYEGHCRPWETFIERAHRVATSFNQFLRFAFFTARLTIQVLHACIIGLIGCHKHWNNTESLYSQPYQYQCHPYLIKSLLRLSANCSARIILSAPNSLYHYMIIWRQVISKFDS